VYCAGVGNLLYLIKYSRLDIANVVCEHAKCMDKATPAAFKEMKRVMRFIAGMKDFGLKMAPIKPGKDKFKWNMVVYLDSDWAGDKEDRRCVSVYVISFWVFLSCASPNPKSQLHSEAEYFASKAAKDVKFIVMVLQSLGIKVEL
jgi:hypothetical protein